MTMPALPTAPLPKFDATRQRIRRPKPYAPGPLRPCFRLAKLAALEDMAVIDAAGDIATLVEDPAQGECRVYRDGVLVATVVGVTDERAEVETIMATFREQLRAFGAALDAENRRKDELR